MNLSDLFTHIPSGTQGDILFRGSSGWETYAGTYNVKAYGALGDNSNDDTAEINAALTAAGNAGGGTVLVPEGTYLISSNILIPNNVELIGLGAGSIIKHINNTGTQYTVTIRNSDHSGGNNKVSVKNLAIDGNHANNTTAQFGVWFKNVTGGTVENVWVYNMRCWGIRIDRCTRIKLSNLDVKNPNITTADAVHFIASSYCVLTNSYLEGLGDDSLSISSEGSDACHNIVCSNLVIKGSSSHRPIWIGLEAEATTNVYEILLENITIPSGGQVVIQGINGCMPKDIQLNNIQFNGSGGNVAALYAIYVDKMTITNCRFTGAQRDGLNWQHVTNSIINNCCFHKNSQLTDNTYRQIFLESSDYNTISNNIIRHGGGANQPAYGIYINTGSDYNMIHGNNLYASGKTSDLTDVGTNSRKRDNIGNAGGWLTDV